MIELGKTVRSHDDWENACTILYKSLTKILYELARKKKYEATDCRRHLGLNMLYHLSLLALEDDIGESEFLNICRSGYRASVDMKKVMEEKGASNVH